MSLEAGWVGVAGPYPVRDGNKLCPWIDGEPAFRRICALIDTAKRTVWATITFMWADFRMPDGRGTALDVLQRAADRGVDVRIMFWRPDDETAHLRRNAFWGSLEQRRQLQSCAPDIKCRWDRSHPGFCQHQKSWLIDGETAFVGGINLNPHSMVKSGHDGEGQNHDIYVELVGPSVVDVTHNFVQRWNEASDRNESDGRFGPGSETELAFPQEAPPAQGSAQVQIQRTCPPGRIMSDGSDGEKSIFAQYIAAINAAREAIYIENQYIEVLEIVVALTAALQRGVAVLWLAPAVPDHRPDAYDGSDRSMFFATRAALGSYDGFMLSGIAGLGEDGRRKPVYVHAKLMIVDDAWATVGSANLHRFSLFGNSEMNVSFHDPAVAKQLRVDLFREHLGLDTADLPARLAFDLFRQVATKNRCLLDKGCADWPGLAFALNVNTYGKARQI